MNKLKMLVSKLFDSELGLKWNSFFFAWNLFFLWVGGNFWVFFICGAVHGFYLFFNLREPAAKLEMWIIKKKIGYGINRLSKRLKS